MTGEQRGARGIVAAYARRVRQGDIGQLPVLVGIVVIWTIFEVASGGVFLAPFNLVNLTSQMAATGTISLGLVVVLLLGEIDLSAGVISGLCAAIVAVLNVQLDVPAPIALGLGLLVGAAVGALHGAWITRFGIPSFVVTLAGLIAWQGALLLVLGTTGSVNLRDPLLTGLAGTYLVGPAAYGCAALFIGYAALGPLVSYRNRRAAGLTVPPLALVALRAGAITALVIAAVVVLDADRGIASGLVFFVAAVIAMDFVLRRRRFGRMIYAIGGNPEAARRAGIPVQRVRVLAFVLASTFAACGGILSASRGRAVHQSAGQGDILINAIAAAVIGGTSLFGGRGTAWAALLGIVVIQSISNGMDLLSLSSPIKLIITGAVLLLTATIDGVVRRR